jgi:hypothetical protein
MLLGRLFGSPRRAAVSLAVMAFALRAIAVLTVFENRFYLGDEQGFFSEAARMAAGRWLGTNTALPPGEVYFLAAGLALGLDMLGLRLVQAALGGLAVAVTVRLSSRLFGLRAGLFAGTAMALYPYFLYLAGVFTTQNQVIPLLLLLVYCLYRRQDGGGRRWLIGGGLALASAGCFMVPVFATAPFLAGWHALRMRRLGRGIRDALLLTVVTTAVLVPVTYRNYEIDRRLMFVSTMTGRALPGTGHVEGPAGEPGVVPPSHTDMGRARAMWLTPGLYLNDPAVGRVGLLLAALISGPVLLFALLGGTLFLRRFALLFPFYALPAVLTVVFASFHTTLRYRLTVEPFLLILAAAAIIRLLWPWHLGGRIGSRLASRSSDPSLTQGVAS